MKLDAALLLSFALGTSVSCISTPDTAAVGAPVAAASEVDAATIAEKEPIARDDRDAGTPPPPRPIGPDYCPPCGMG